TFTFDATAGIGSSYEIGFEVNGGAATFTTLVDGGNFIVPSASFTAGVNTVVLTSIEDQGGSLNCVNTTVRDTLLVTVEPTPAVELSLTDDTGTTAPLTSPFGPQGFCASMMNTLAFTADTTVTGAAPLTGRIYLSVTVDQDAADRLGFGAPGTYTRDVAGFDSQLAAIGLANAGTTNDTVIFSVTPYIETDTLSAPAGTAFNPAAECGGTPVEVNFFVYPAFTASIAGDQDACEGSSATLTILGPAGGTVDLTDGTTTSTIAINNLGIGSFTTPALTATTTYSLATATSSAANGSCERPATGSVTVTVVPDPAAGLMITGPAGVICEGTSDTILVMGGPAAGELFYVIGAATTASVVTLDAAGEAKIPVAPTVTTTYTFDSVRTTTPIVCTSALTDVVTVTVNPAPAGSLSNSGAICNGGTVMFTYTDTTGNANGPFDLVISGVSYTGIVDGTPFASTNPAPTVTTTYTLDTIVDMNGCGSLNVPADTTEVTVEDVPEITIDIDLPLDSNLTATNSSPGAPFSVTYCSGTRFLADAVSSTLMSSAGDSLWIDLEIVDPGMLIGGNWSVRLPLASFILDTIPVNTSGVDQTFTMEFTPYYETMPMPGATVGAGECVGETILLSVTIQPQPTATITLADMTVCAGDSTDITLSGTPNAIVSLTGPNGNFTRTLDGMGNLVFSSGPLTSSTDFVITAITNPGNGCTVDVVIGQSIAVTPTPTAAFTAAVTNPICAGSSTSFSITGGPANGQVDYTRSDMTGPPITATLDAGGTVVINTGPLADTVTFTLVEVRTDAMAAPVCSAPLTETLAINVIPAPTGTLTNNGPVCNGQPITLTYNATVGTVGGSYDLTINGSVVTVTEGVAFPAPSGAITYDVTNIVDNSTGCTATGSILATTTPVQESVPNLRVNVSSLPAVLLNSDAMFTTLRTYNASLCSGSPFNFTSSTTTTMSSAGDPLYIMLMVTSDPLNAFGQGTAGGTFFLTPAQFTRSMNALVNPSISQNATITATARPYYETNPAAPSAPTAGTCTGNLINFNITVRPALQVSLVAANTEVCAGAGGTLNFIQGTPGATVTVTSVDSTFNVVLNASGTATRQVGPFTTNYSYEVTRIALRQGNANVTDSCIVIPTGQIVTYTVNPLPAGTIDVTQNSTCNGGDTYVTFTSSVGTAPFTVDLDGTTYTTDINGDPITGTGDSILFVTGLTTDVTYELLAITDDNGCTTAAAMGGNLDSELVEVNAVPDLTVSVTNPTTTMVTATTDANGTTDYFVTACSGEQFSFTSLTTTANSVDGEPIRFEIRIVDTTGMFNFPTDTTFRYRAENGSAFTRTLGNITTNVVGVKVRVTPFFQQPGTLGTLDPGECAGPPVEIEVRVNPVPQSPASVPNTTVCSDSALNISLSSLIANNIPGVTTFTYDVASSNPTGVPPATNRFTSSAANITDTYTNTTTGPVTITYNVRPFNGTCFGSEFQVRAIINPEPVLAAGISGQVCSGDMSGITLATNGTSVAAADYTINTITFSNTNASEFFASVGSSNAVTGPNQGAGAVSGD
ncbi:MAG: PKD-like domain-containing protein, partial [Saprospiraceae bacterium]